MGTGRSVGREGGRDGICTNAGAVIGHIAAAGVREWAQHSEGFCGAKHCCAAASAFR